MDDKAGSGRIPLQLIQGCLVASIQVDLTDHVLSRFRQDLLARIGSAHVHGVVLDVSGVEVMDSVDFEMLKTTMTMASIMGATPVIVGLKPGIVSALVDMDVDTRDVRAALNLDDALQMLGASETNPAAPGSETEGHSDATGQ
jgi:rsbT antagonist protein RsbS